MAIASSATSIAGHPARRAAEINNPSRDLTGGVHSIASLFKDKATHISRIEYRSTSIGLGFPIHFAPSFRKTGSFFRTVGFKFRPA